MNHAFMGLQSQVELTPPRPGQLGRYSGEHLLRLNSSEFKNPTVDKQNSLIYQYKLSYVLK